MKDTAIDFIWKCKTLVTLEIDWLVYVRNQKFSNWWLCMSIRPKNSKKILKQMQEACEKVLPLCKFPSFFAPKLFLHWWNDDICTKNWNEKSRGKKARDQMLIFLNICPTEHRTKSYMRFHAAVRFIISCCFTKYTYKPSTYIFVYGILQQWMVYGITFLWKNMRPAEFWRPLKKYKPLYLPKINAGKIVSNVVE